MLLLLLDHFVGLLPCQLCCYLGGVWGSVRSIWRLFAGLVAQLITTAFLTVTVMVQSHPKKATDKLQCCFFQQPLSYLALAK